MKILEIREWREGGTFWGSFLENPEGRGGGLYSKSLLWGCMDMFWNNIIAGTSRSSQ